MLKNMKTMEVKPKVKEYDSIQDYFDDVIAKTYDVLKNDALKGMKGTYPTDNARWWNVKKMFDGSKTKSDVKRWMIEGTRISYFAEDPTDSHWDHSGMTIDTPAVYVRASVRRFHHNGKPYDAQEPNTELVVRRKKPTGLTSANNLGVYKEIEGALQTGLKEYGSARVAYKR